MQWHYTAQRANDWQNNTLCSCLDPPQYVRAALQLFCSAFMASVTMGVFETDRKCNAGRGQSFCCHILATHPLLKESPAVTFLQFTPSQRTVLLSHSCNSPRPKGQSCCHILAIHPIPKDSPAVTFLQFTYPNNYHVILALTYNTCYIL